MKAFLLGTADDVRGFALAGIDGVTCATREEVERAAAELKLRTDVALVLVSREVEKLAPAVITALAGEPPAVVVLP